VIGILGIWLFISGLIGGTLVSGINLITVGIAGIVFLLLCALKKRNLHLPRLSSLSSSQKAVGSPNPAAFLFITNIEKARIKKKI